MLFQQAPINRVVRRWDINLHFTVAFSKSSTVILVLQCAPEITAPSQKSGEKRRDPYGFRNYLLIYGT